MTVAASQSLARHDRDARPSTSTTASSAESNVAYVLIGGHAVNTWLEPRFTGDIDITVQAGPGEVQRLGDLLAARGYPVTRVSTAPLSPRGLMSCASSPATTR